MSGPDVSYCVILSGFRRVWSVGSSVFMGPDVIFSLTEILFLLSTDLRLCS